MAEQKHTARRGPKRPSARRQATRIVREVGSARLVATALFLIIALLIARFSWSLVFVDSLERVLYDVRASYAMERVDEDERILLIVYDENTLFDTGVRSPLDRAILARALTNIDAMGARGIAIDILIDQPTPNDRLLTAALRAMRTPTFLALVDPNSDEFADIDVQPRQFEFLTGFIGALEGSSVRATSVRVDADKDNVARAWPIQQSGQPPLIAHALAPGHDAFRDHRGSIAYRLPAFEDGEVFTKLPIDMFADAEMAGGLADLVRGRYVLIGADLLDRDRFETPFSRLTTGGTIAGLELHAHLLAQMLDGEMLRPIPGWALWGIALIAVVAGALTNLGDMRLWTRIAALGAQIAVVALLPFTLQREGIDTQALPVFGLIMGWAIAYATVGTAARAVGSEKRRFVQVALGRYLPPDVADAIVADPDRLSLTGEKRALHVIFTDLQGFTALSHTLEPEAVAKLLNAYLDRLSEIVLAHGGTLDKFVGDALVAFWGAPIPRDGDGERAVRCAIALRAASEGFREEGDGGGPPLGETRVGLHSGEAIVGNFGGRGRIQYTALGDVMNTASRLESANKQTGTAILASREAIEGTDTSAFRPLGRVTLSGRATPVEIFEPVSQITAATRETVEDCWRRFEHGDRDAINALEALATRHPDDAPLRKMVYRLKHMEPGGSYVLEGK